MIYLIPTSLRAYYLFKWGMLDSYDYEAGIHDAIHLDVFVEMYRLRQ